MGFFGATIDRPSFKLYHFWSNTASPRRVEKAPDFPPPALQSLSPANFKLLLRKSLRRVGQAERSPTNSGKIMVGLRFA